MKKDTFSYLYLDSDPATDSEVVWTFVYGPNCRPSFTTQALYPDVENPWMCPRSPGAKLGDKVEFEECYCGCEGWKLKR